MTEKDEVTLRQTIREMIRYVKDKKQNDEYVLRSLIREMMDIEYKNLSEGQTPDVDPSPNKSTGINVLEELLKKIIPVLETDYKSLTTNNQQRESFRAHIINAVINTLTPARVNTDAGEESELQEIDVDEEIDIKIGGDEKDDKFIDIRTDAEKASEEEAEEESKEMRPVGMLRIKVLRKSKPILLIHMSY